MIPSQTLEEFEPFAESGDKVAPVPAKYAQGYLPGEVFPAQHENFLMGKASRCSTQHRAGLRSVEAELNNVVDAGGAEPDNEDDTQVLTAINYLIAAAEARAKLAAHPKGSLFWTSEPPTITVEGVEQANPEGDPQLLFGGGTWVRIKDTFIWAAGDNDTVVPSVYTKEDGALTATIGVNNLPAHTHALGGNTGSTQPSFTNPSYTTSDPSPILKGSIQFRKYYNGNNPGWVHNDSGSSMLSEADASGSLGQFDSTSTEKGSRYFYINATHKHTISVSTGGSVESHTHTLPADTGDNTTTATALSIKNPRLNRYCWQRTA